MISHCVDVPDGCQMVGLVKCSDPSLASDMVVDRMYILRSRGDKFWLEGQGIFVGRGGGLRGVGGQGGGRDGSR